MRIKGFVRVMGFWLSLTSVTDGVAAPEATCVSSSVLQAARSNELQTLVAADQAERRALDLSDEGQCQVMTDHDRLRRKRVAEIFAEGCLQSASDYAAAAMVYQHGEVPDHYYQAFLWSQRGVEKGDATQRHLMALAIDRYLINTGKKQLFASQYFSASMDLCFCLEPVEASFPDHLRLQYTGHTYEDSWQYLETLNEGRCAPSVCDHTLEDTPVGSIVGFW